ncbi:LuxR C-terminal-related transcriptional regulator [Desulfovibrio sp. OttesenSCG-928-M16]|nr:LuxR C-terminal-related transcriptional regulator [Desulfovibrio sp. OttesenSCG-928-M16]
MRINRTLSFWLVLTSFGFAWTLALPFEGTLLYALLERDSFLPESLVFELVLAVCAGLSSASLFVKNRQSALWCFRLSLLFALGVTLFAFISSPWLRPLLWLASLFMGINIASMAFYTVRLETPMQRYRAMADFIIYGNVWMIASDVLTVHLSIEAGLMVCALALCTGLYGTSGIEQALAESSPPQSLDATGPSVLAPLAFLTTFIAIICINSGLMYQVLVPAFSGVKGFASFYWAIPYIAAIWLLRRFPSLLGPKQILFTALSMNGLAFLAFGILDRSLPSYLAVNTLMLFACGIYDLFWWSVLACLSRRHRNPALVMGMGLGGNVLGVLIGGVIGDTIYTMQPDMGLLLYAVPLALFIICMIMTMLNPLHKVLRTYVGDSPLLKDDVEKETITETILVPVSSAEEQSGLPDDLTEQERRIAALIHKGRTYEMIAEELFISKNTVKFHIKNIYGKCGVGNKAEFIKFLKTARVKAG